MKFRTAFRPSERPIYTYTSPCELTDDMIRDITPLRVWQVVVKVDMFREVDHGLFASEESARQLKERLCRAYPEDAPNIMIKQMVVGP